MPCIDATTQQALSVTKAASPHTADSDEQVFGQRLTAPIEIDLLLSKLIQTGALVTLSAPDGGVYSTSIWVADADRGVVSLDANQQDPGLAQLLQCNDIIAQTYLDGIRLQFNVDGMVQVYGEQRALNIRYPSEIIRFQRRSSFRVQPLVSSAPCVKLYHPSIPEMQLVLRVLDVSLGGVAAALPHNVPQLEPSTLIANCDLKLDATSSISSDLLLHHITAIGESSGSQQGGEEVRLGFEFHDLSADAQQILLAYINHTQKRQRVIRS